MLRAALRAGLAPAADDEAFAMARSAAQIVGLPGIDACVAALEPHRGGAWSEAALGLVESIEHHVADESLAAIRAGDRALQGRAEMLAQHEDAHGRAGDQAGEEETFAPAEPPPG